MNIPSKTLTKALETLRPLFSGRSTLPATSMIALTVTDKLTISANDLSLYCSLPLECEPDQPFEIAVAGLRLLNACKSAGENINLTVKDKSLYFVSDGMKMRISGVDLAELPAVPTIETTGAAATGADELDLALNAVLGFVSRDASRAILQGVCFESGKGRLHLIATNGHMLANTAIETKCGEINAIMSESACDLLKSITGEVIFNFSENGFSADSADMKIVGALLEGRYPQWRNVVPAKKEATVSATFNREAFLNALPFVSSVVNVAGRQIVTAVFDKEIHLSAKSDESEADTTIPATIQGKITIAFDVAFMLSLLRSFTTEEITLHMRDERSPILIEQGVHQAVILPVRVS